MFQIYTDGLCRNGKYIKHCAMVFNGLPFSLSPALFLALKILCSNQNLIMCMELFTSIKFQCILHWGRHHHWTRKFKIRLFVYNNVGFEAIDHRNWEDWKQMILITGQSLCSQSSSWCTVFPIFQKMKNLSCSLFDHSHTLPKINRIQSFF